jgi:NSS family neurotransmitter:Na+ symporter
MLTYGSYIGKRDNLFSAAGAVCFFDTLIALLAGLIIFPTLYHAGFNPAEPEHQELIKEGTNLVFVVLPTLFTELPAGLLFGAGFFLLLAIAALTSTISLLEVPVSYLVDEWHLTRGKAVFCTSVLTLLIGVPSALGCGAVSFLGSIPGVDVSFLGLMSIVFGNYSLAIGSLLLAIFVGYRWGVRAATAEVESSEGVVFRYRLAWAFLIRFLCPVAIALILTYMIVTGQTLS